MSPEGQRDKPHISLVWMLRGSLSFRCFSHQLRTKTTGVRTSQILQWVNTTTSHSSAFLSQDPHVSTWSVSLSFCDARKPFPVYLVFCYIPPQRKSAYILGSEAEHHTECSKASLSKWRRWRDDQRDLAETAAMTVWVCYLVHRQKEWWSVCERDKKQLSGFISKEDGNVLLSLVCPKLSLKVVGPPASLHFLFCFLVQNSTKSSYCFMQIYLHRNGQKKMNKKVQNCSWNPQKQEQFISCRNWTWGVRSMANIRSRLEQSQCVFSPSVSVSITDEMMGDESRGSGPSLLAAGDEVSVPKAARLGVGVEGVLLRGYGPLVKLRHPPWCHRHTSCWEIEYKEDK